MITAHNIRFLLGLALVSLLCSCVRDPWSGADTQDDGTDHMTLYINVPRAAIPPTRAIEDGSEADNAVESITILLFDKQDGDYSGSVPADELSDGDNYTRKTFTALIPEGEFDALVVANADDVLAGFDLEGKDLAFAEQNLAATVIGAGNVKWNADPQSQAFRPFPMSGRFEIPADNRVSPVTIFLVRMLAKIDVKLAFEPDPDSPYRINSVRLLNYNRIGNLISKDNGGETLSVFDPSQLNIPSEPDYVSGLSNALIYSGAQIQPDPGGVPGQQCVDEIFLPETDASGATCLLIEIFIPSIGQYHWFRVNMEMKGETDELEPVNIQRNFRYTLNITGITGRGFATPEDAYDSPAEGTVTELTAIDDSDLNDMTSDGRNLLTVNKSDFVFYTDGSGQELKVFTDYVSGWGIVEKTASWFRLSVTAGLAGVSTPVTLSCDPNTGSTVRTGTFVITAGVLRKTITIIQVPAIEKITNTAPPAGFFPYVGAFWKSNQTGERLIRMARPEQPVADGDWVAVVVQGGDWIQLDTEMTTDSNVGWLDGATGNSMENGNDAGFDSRHQVEGDLKWVKGTMDEEDADIYFRIGLNGPLAARPDDPARYGLILLAYNNYTKLQRIWIRQGENADYLMSPGDPNSTGSQIVDNRSFAGQFSPYNLTDPAQNTETDFSKSSLLPAQGGVFTEYPSQAGYLFTFNTNHALYPTPSSAGYTNWPAATSSVWDTETHETCPEGYRRAKDIVAGTIAGSEMRQSLWWNPQNGTAINNADNMAWGYYADGFFDRREIVSSINSGVTGMLPSAAVASPGPDVAYEGVLVFNPVAGSTHYNASLFLPSGGLVNNGQLSFVGSNSSLWTSTSHSANLAWGTGMNARALGDNYVSYQSTNMGMSIRCVLDPDQIPPDPVDPKTVIDTPVATQPIPDFYIGAFWKADQTGERLIRIPRPSSGKADGKWTAQVIEGQDWITLDTKMTTDPNVGWRTDVTPNELQVHDPVTMGADFDDQHAVDGTWWVKGSMDASIPQYYFRIGLKSKYTPTSSAPARYGIVLLTYGGNKYQQRIWIRQGEVPDYLFSNDDKVDSGNLTERTVTVRFSPYNLTAPEGLMNTELGFQGGVFTNYPSQAGALFLWLNTTAWAPIGMADNAPSSAVILSGFWDEHKNTDETCPYGYHRINDGSTNAAVDGNDISQSEIRQSLWQEPQTGGVNQGSTINMTPGYYADGYFDCRKMQSSSTGIGSSTVSPSDAYNVAYKGVVFFNPKTNASIFLPFAGRRSGENSIVGSGSQLMLWSSSRASSTNSYYAWFASIGATYAFMNNTSFYNNSIRCVAND